MFLWSAQKNSHIILSSYVDGHVQKNSSMNFMSSIGFQTSKIWMFLFFVELVWKLFSGRSCSLEPPVFWFYNNQFHMVWKNQSSWEIGLDGFWGNRHSKMQKKKFCWQIFFLHFEPLLWIYKLLWNTKFCFF